jgi:hypothetical protein
MSDRTQTPPDRQKMIIATLFLERVANIDYRLMTERIGDALKIDHKSALEHKPGDAMVLLAGGDLVSGLQIDAPYPDNLDHATAFAYWWPDAKNDISRHRAHLLVAGNWFKHSRLHAHIRHSVLVHELLDQLPVIGVLWGSVLTPPNIFKGEFASTLKGAVPFSLWVLIQFSKQPGGNILISTLGMGDFGLMEIETESSLSLEQTYDLVRKFGCYILANGPVVRDGETMGQNADERIKVRHIRSFRPDVNDNVYWLELTDKPTVHRPGGIFSPMFGSKNKQ